MRLLTCIYDNVFMSSVLPISSVWLGNIIHVVTSYLCRIELLQCFYPDGFLDSTRNVLDNVNMWSCHTWPAINIIHFPQPKLFSVEFMYTGMMKNHVKKYVCVHKGVRHVHFLNLDKSCKCTAYPVFPQNVLKVKRQWKRLKILG